MGPIRSRRRRTCWPGRCPPPCRWPSPARCAPRATTAGTARGTCSTPRASRRARRARAEGPWWCSTARSSPARRRSRPTPPTWRRSPRPTRRRSGGSTAGRVTYGAGRPPGARRCGPTGLGARVALVSLVVGDDGTHAGPGPARARRRGGRGVRQRQHAAGRGAGRAALAGRGEAGRARHAAAPRARSRRSTPSRAAARARSRWARFRPGPRTPSQARMELVLALSAGVALRRAMSAPAAPAIPDEVLEIARTLEAAGPRGLVRRRRAPRRAAGPPPRGLRLRHVGHAGAGHRAVPTHGARRREVRHGGRARPPPGAPRGDHLPPRRRDGRPPRGRGLRRVARGGPRPARLHHQRHRVSPAARASGATRSADAADLDRGVVRAVGEPAERFREDYLRILRACASRPGSDSRIEPATWAAAVEAAPGLAQLSAERVRDEWFKGLRTARAVPELVELWHRSRGRRDRWMPELAAAPAERVARTGAAPLERRDPVLLTALLVDDAADVLRRLRASNAEIERAAAIGRGPAAPAGERPARRAPLALHRGQGGRRSDGAPRAAHRRPGAVGGCGRAHRGHAAIRSPAVTWR